MGTGDFNIKVLGTRGSMSVSGAEYSIFGGATSSYLVQAGAEHVFLDAGTGIANAPTEFENTPVIIISHPHLDHLLGLGMYPRLSKAGSRTRICLPAKDDGEARRLLDGIFSPPYWPVSMELYSGDIQTEALQFPMQLGGLTIDGIGGNHPGGSEIVKLSYKGKSIVYITDYEYEESSFEELKAFSRDAELILYDGQYEPEEAELKKGFGHSTAQKGIELLEAAGAKSMLLVHHDPLSTDEILLQREGQLNRNDIRYARQGETVEL